MDRMNHVTSKTEKNNAQRMASSILYVVGPVVLHYVRDVGNSSRNSSICILERHARTQYVRALSSGEWLSEFMALLLVYKCTQN